MNAPRGGNSCVSRPAPGGGGANRSLLGPWRPAAQAAALSLSFLLPAANPSTAAADPAGDGPPVPRLALDEAIRAGLSDNPDLAALRADAGASGAGRRTAEAERWPNVYTEAGWRRSNNQVIVFGDKLTAGEFTAADFDLDSLNHPDAINHGVVAVGVEVPIDVSGRVGAGIDAARDAETAAKSSLRAADIDLVARITEAYQGIGLADEAVTVAGQALEYARRTESVAAARAGSGATLKTEALRARAATLERERDLDRRRADAALARSRLAILMGRGAGFPIGSVEPPPASPADLGTLDSWLQDAPSARADVDAARQGSAAAGAQAASARATRGPEMGARARYELNASGLDTGEGSYLLGLSVRWSAWDGGRASRIEEASARATAAAARVRSLEDRVGLEVERAWRDAQVADRGVVAAQEAATASEEARRISAERYAAGLLPLTDLLDTETAAVAARLGEITARYDATVARVHLMHAAGRLEVPR